MPLLYVLWTISLLTIIAVASQSSGTLSYRLVRNTADAAQYEAFAEAVLNRAVLSLLDERASDRLPVDGSAETFTFNDIAVTARIQDEQGRIDINHADGALLANLFRAADVPTDKAGQLADRILDWRDPDHLKRLNGAEQKEYRQAGLPYQPRNGSFMTIEELKLVLGMTSDLFRHVRPALTIYSGKPTIDPRLAPPLARRALYGANASQASTGSAGLSPSRNLPARHLRAGHAYRILVEFSWKGTPVTREAIIRYRNDRSDPYWLLKWQ